MGGFCLSLGQVLGLGSISLNNGGEPQAGEEKAGQMADCSFHILLHLRRPCRIVSFEMKIWDVRCGTFRREKKERN